MARAHGRILTSIWEDPDFLRLGQREQRLYLFLISQPNTNHAGLLPLTLRRWSGKAAGLTVDELETVLTALEEARFVVVDRDTEEVLIRTFVRNDGVWRQPKVMAAMVSAAGEICSVRLRRVLLAEMDRLPLQDLSDEPGARGPSVRQQIADHIAALRQTLHVPDPTPPEPVEAVSQTPAEDQPKGSGRVSDTPDEGFPVPPTRAHTPASRAHSPAPTPVPYPSHKPLPPVAGAPAREDAPWTRADHEALPERMLTAWWAQYGRTTAQGRRSVHDAIAEALRNGLDPDELWQALIRLGEASKPVSGGTLQFALSDLRRPVVPAGAANVVPLRGGSPPGSMDRFAEHVALYEKLAAEEAGGAVVTCPSCKGRKTPGQYLCRSCWFRLTPAARRALNRPDSGAYGRLRALYRQLEDGVPLGEIEVAP